MPQQFRGPRKDWRRVLRQKPGEGSAAEAVQECVRVGVHTYRLALQGLWGDGLRGDAGRSGSPLRGASILLGRGQSLQCGGFWI